MKSTLGRKGEDFACEYLVKKDYKIVDRNVRKPWGELDIVAQCGDGTLVFVEVKTMKKINNEQGNREDGIRPEDQITDAKLRKMKKAARLYAGHYPEKIHEDRGWRIDVLALNVSGDYFEVEQYENVAG